MEKLAALKPVFGRGPRSHHDGGQLDAADGRRAVVLLASEEWAEARGLPVLAYLDGHETAAVDFVPRRTRALLMAPAYAVPRMLERAGLGLEDFDWWRSTRPSPPRCWRRWRPGRNCGALGLDAARSTDRTG